MFDDLIQGEDKPTWTEALLKLLDPDEREAKTLLEMPNIRFLMKAKWLELRKLHRDKTIIERQVLFNEYYMKLKLSLKAHSWTKIVEGIKEMRPEIIQGNLMEGPR